ncbi:MAG: metal-dependent phosphohydrolase, partial [Halanaerobium sp.]
PIVIIGFAVLNPFWAAILSALGSIEFRFLKRNFIWYKFLFNRSILFLAAAFAGFSFDIANVYLDKGSFPFLSILLASIVYFLINNTLVYIVIRIAENDINNLSLLSYFRELSKNLIISYFVGLILLGSYLFFGKLLFLLVILLL